MNMKKLSVMVIALALAATSAFAWSKKSTNTGNLGRMYISVEGGVNVSKAKSIATGETSSPTGAQGTILFNAPVFKPGVGAFKDIKWAGVDASAAFNYNYSGSFNLANTSFDTTNYGVMASVTPYLNFVTTLPVFKAIKPFGMGFAGYNWSTISGDVSGNTNYFIYGVGAGVEVVIIDQLSFTPYWKWNGNAESGLACTQAVGADLSYWFSDQFCFSVFWNHDFGAKYGAYEVVHSDVIGAKFKIGFMR